MLDGGIQGPFFVGQPLIPRGGGYDLQPPVLSRLRLQLDLHRLGEAVIGDDEFQPGSRIVLGLQLAQKPRQVGLAIVCGDNHRHQRMLITATRCGAEQPPQTPEEGQNIDGQAGLEDE